MSDLATSFLAARVFNTPLMITWAKAQVIIGVLSPHFGLESGLPIQPGPTPPTQDAVVNLATPARYRAEQGNPDGIGVIQIHGTLVHRTGALLSASSGLLTYNKIRAQFAEGLNDDSVTSILLDIDSFGGEVSGVFDLADDIYQARGTKPIYAIADENAYSAAYALASAADKVYLPRTGGVGSIGVIAVHIDQSGFNSKIGVVYTPIFSGDQKNDFSPHAHLPDRAKAVAQREVDQIRDLFVETVARNRNLSPVAVRATQAALYQGQDAVKEGLADGIANYSQVVEMLTNLNNKKGEKKSMFNIGKKAAPVTPDVAGQAEDQKPAEPGYVPARSEGYKEGVEEGIAWERARCVQIQEQLAAVSHLMVASAADTLLNQLLKSGVSPELAGQQIISALAAAQSGPSIRSTVSATSTGEINPVVAEALRRAQASQANQERRN